MAKQKKPHAPMIRLDAELYERVEWDWLVGERGTTLSGRQRQRLPAP